MSYFIKISVFVHELYKCLMAYNCFVAILTVSNVNSF